MNLRADIFTDSLKSKVAEKFGGEKTFKFQTIDK